MNYENMLTLKNRLSKYNAGSFLDVAVGRGDFLKFAINSFHAWKSATGIDIDPDSLRIAQQELAGTNVILVQGSALSMPFIDHYFDTLTMSNTLHHIESLPALFKETNRICKPRGLIIVNEMIHEGQSGMQETYMLYHRFIAEVDNQLGRYHHEPFALKELQSIIKASGLELKDYFIHSENTGDAMNASEMEAMSERVKNRITLLRGTDYYYFYENKAREIINRFKKTGIFRPRHVTFVLQTG